MTVRVQTADFDVGQEIARLRARRPQRRRDRDRSSAPCATSTTRATITGMTLEHYPGMTEAALERNRRRGARAASTFATRSSSIVSARSRRATRSCWSS